jgi:hypothetical protein
MGQFDSFNVDIQFSWHHLLKKLSFLHCVFLLKTTGIPWKSSKINIEIK